VLPVQLLTALPLLHARAHIPVGRIAVRGDTIGLVHRVTTRRSVAIKPHRKASRHCLFQLRLDDGQQDDFLAQCPQQAFLLAVRRDVLQFAQFGLSSPCYQQSLRDLTLSLPQNAHILCGGSVVHPFCIRSICPRTFVIAITKGVGLSYECVGQWVEASRDMISFGEVIEPVCFFTATEVGRLKHVKAKVQPDAVSETVLV
jgi:hypothetical protein